MPTDVIYTAQQWPTNGHLIADVARLGYITGDVLDVTHGYGTFWKEWIPDSFTACDIDPNKSPLGCSVDFRTVHTEFGTDSFDTVVFDPPYKLNGTPTDSADERYGVHTPTRWQDRMEIIYQGLLSCKRVTRKYLLVKCMDQVVSGRKVYQTHAITSFLCDARDPVRPIRLADRFDMLINPRPQPVRGEQKHSRQNYSTLLVFERI